MSEFAAEVRRIEIIEKHPGADRLSIATVQDLDYQFITGLDSYKPFEQVVYIPLDSVLPAPLIALLGLTGMLAGSKKNRVKTVKLRGEISQGLVVGVDKLIEEGYIEGREYSDGEDVTEMLLITKYEPPVVGTMTGNLHSLPEGVEKYDLESCQRHSNVAKDLILYNVPVVITEKLEGTNIAMVLDTDNVFSVCSRKHRIEEIECEGKENLYAQTARAGKWEKLAARIKEEIGCRHLVLRGELIGPGVQGNIYGLESKTIKLFDIKADGRYLDHDEMCIALHNVIGGTYRSRMVPVLSADRSLGSYAGDKGLQEASDGYSHLNKTTPREGIVIKPMHEIEHYKLGRLILKQRSPEYLAQSKGV